MPETLQSRHARDAAEGVARTSYGRLLALVARRTGDIAGAEDALSEAFAAALRTWPDKGVPDRPEAWLLTVADRSLGQVGRHAKVRQSAGDVIRMLHDESVSEGGLASIDDRLRLLFVCAHPAIDPDIRTPLMLQTVLGLDAHRIGQSFLIRGTTMGQRLVRAKSKMRDAGIPFEMPEPDAMARRLGDVLAAIYAAFTIGWSDHETYTDYGADFIDEALFLARLVADAMPREAEPRGLLALMLYCEARRPARRTADGGFVPLELQDWALWSSRMIAEAEGWLRLAAELRKPGRYQTEAAIQSYHVQLSQSLGLPASPLLQLYDLLVQQTDSLGAAIARAAAYGRFGRAQEALGQIDSLPVSQVEGHQPFWVTRAAILLALGEKTDALEAFGRAIDLTADSGLRSHLERKRAEVNLT